MTRVVLDTNTLVSATLIPSGISGQILAHARQRRFTIIMRSAITTGLFRVLAYPRIQRKHSLAQADIGDLGRFLRRRAIITELTREVHGVATHPEDDLILATAVSGKANYLVTGDSKLQALGTFEEIAIVRPRAFLEILNADPATGV